MAGTFAYDLNFLYIRQKLKSRKNHIIYTAFITVLNKHNNVSLSSQIFASPFRGNHFQTHYTSRGNASYLQVS